MSAKEYPRKIFVESSLLFQLGPRLENVEFASLLEIGKSEKCEMYVSEVSWLEYLRERKREFRKHLESGMAIQKALDQHGKSIPEQADAFQKIRAYLEDIDAHYRAKAAERGLKIIPLPKIDLNRLLTMSVDCIPPFEDPESKTKEKGFRDSLIMFSILENLRGRPEDNALVITNDRLLAEGLALHAEEYQTHFRIATTFDQASAIISEAITEAEQLRLRRAMEEAVNMLMSYKEEILARVGEVTELSDWDLGQGLSLGYSKERHVDIRSLESVSFDRITSAIWKDKEGNKPRILFSCLCNAKVVANAPHLRPFVDPTRRHKIGQVTSSLFISLISGTYDSGPTEKVTLPFQMYGEAQLTNDGQNWHLLSLRIDKSPPSEEELSALIEANQAGLGSAAAG